MPKLTPEIEQRIREACAKATVDGIANIWPGHILAALDDLAEARRKISDLVAVANKHNWNGVTNSKILSVFFDEALAERDQLRQERDAAMRVVKAYRYHVKVDRSANAPKVMDCLRDIQRDYPHLFEEDGRE